MIIEPLKSTAELNWLKAKGYLEAMNQDESQAFVSVLNKGREQDGLALFEEGEHDSGVFIIRRGTVEIGHTKQEHARVDQGFYGVVDYAEREFSEADWLDHVTLQEGDCVGELEALIGQAHQLTARTKGDVELFYLNPQRLKELAAQNGKVCQCIAKAMARSLSKLNRA